MDRYNIKEKLIARFLRNIYREGVYQPMSVSLDRCAVNKQMGERPLPCRTRIPACITEYSESHSVALDSQVHALENQVELCSLAPRYSREN